MSIERRSVLLFRPAAVLALVCLCSVGGAGAQGGGPDLSSPRATFETFLPAMIDAKAGDDARLETAVACLDLEGYAPAVREEIGGDLARDLKTYLDKVELIDTTRIPDVPEGREWVYLRVPQGEVKLVLKEDGRWLFSRSTLEALPALLKSVAKREFVEGIEGGGGGGGERRFVDWVRPKLPDSLRKEFFILEGWQWLGLLVVAFAGIVVDRLIRLFLGAWLRRLMEKTGKAIGREFDVKFEQPAGILAMAFVWSLLLRPLALPLGAYNALVIATRFLMAAAGVWAAYRLVDLVAAYLGTLATKTESTLDDMLVPMVRRALKVVIVAFGIVFIAQNQGINVSSLLAGLGIGGIAFALAAKDTVENLFGSFTVVIDRPFKIGDWVVIGDLEGTVEELGLRSTRIRTFYNSLITVPNSTLVQASVDNLGERRYRRVKCMISIQYDTPAEKIEAFCEGIRELIRRHPYTRKDYYNVYFNEFAASALNILLYAFHECPDWTTELRERHRLFVDIVRLAQRLGVEFAYPTQTLHIASMPGQVKADAATPATGPSWSPAGHEDAIRLGREEAQEIAATMWGEQVQPPVNFGDPERIRTGTGGDDPV